MNKSEFINELASECNFTKSYAKEIYESFIDIIKEQLIKGEDVYLQGLGKFSLVQTKERKAYNLVSKQMTKVKPSKKLKFYTSLSFKEFIN